jgi:hypothetical protein
MLGWFLFTYREPPVLVIIDMVRIQGSRGKALPLR